MVQKYGKKYGTNSKYMVILGKGPGAAPAVGLTVVWYLLGMTLKKEKHFLSMHIQKV